MSEPRVAFYIGAPLALLVIAALACTSCVAASGDREPEESSEMPVAHDLPAPPCSRPPLGASFVRRDGSALSLDAQPFRALGANAYYLQQLFAYEEQGRPELAEPALQALDQIACLGFDVVRLLAFNDSDDSTSIRTAPMAYQEAGLRGLDRAIAEAKQRGLRVVLPLVNNWDDYGGLPRYAEWAGKRPSARDDFFSDGPMRDYFKHYAAMLAERVNTYTGIEYRNEPAILAWEIGNELRCPSCKGGTRWLDTMRELAAFLKMIAPNHLIADGGDGLDDAPEAYPDLSNRYYVRGAEGTSFSRLLEIEELDLVSYHMYFGPRSFRKTRDIEIWIDGHERQAQAANKVAYLGEFGLQPKKADMDADSQRAASFHHWLNRVFVQNDGSLALFWQLIPAARRPAGDDGYGVVYDQDPATASVLNDWAQGVRRR